jgi:hypothetical protein
MNFPKKDIKYYDTDSSNNSTNNYTNNIVQTNYLQRNQTFNKLSNFELRKIIKEEFESQIIPYKNEIQKLHSEINNFYMNENKDSIEQLIKEIRKNLFNCVDKKLFDQKISEIELLININNKKNDMKIINSLINEIKKINLEIKNIKYNNNFLSESNKNNLIQNKSNENINNSSLNLNEIKIKDIIDKNIFFQKDIENLKAEMKSIKTFSNSSIMENSKMVDELDLKFENFKNDDSSMKLNLYRDINKVKEEIKKIKNEFNEMKIDNESAHMNSMNQNLDIKIYEILEKLNLTKLSKLDIDKFNMIIEAYEQLEKNYLIISQKVKNQNDSVNSLLTKLNLISSELKVKKNIINQDNNNDIIKNKYEYLERQVQHMENRLEQILLDSMKIKESNINYEKRKEEFLLMKKGISEVNKQMEKYITLNEENEKRREEINLRIDEIKNELKEEKNINMENKMNILQNQTGIKSIKEKLNPIEDKNNILEKIILKLDGEKIKNLENQIINIDKNLSKHIDEEKKLEELKNQIIENNKRNNEEKINDRFNEIEDRIKNIKEEINNINMDKKGSGIDELKIKNIEEHIKQLNEDINKSNKNKILSENIENKISNNSNEINKLNEKLSEFEGKQNIIEKEIENLKNKINKPLINENKIKNIENIDIIKNENIEEEKKEEEKKEEKKKEQNNIEEWDKKSKNSKNLAREIIDSRIKSNESKNDVFDDFDVDVINN